MRISDWSSDVCSSDLIREQGSVRAALDHHEPWAVINAAGFVRVADAEKEVDACLAANAAGASILAHECTAAGIPLMTFSSDLVFDGREGPYCETDRVNPTSVYGRSKAEAEYWALAARSEEHTSELQSLTRRLHAVF